MLALVACTPDLEPPWVLQRPTELALSIEVETPEPVPRTFHQFLPGERVRLTPLVAGPGGRIDPSELDMHWVLCDSGVPCLQSLGRARELEPCEGLFQPGTSCWLDQGGVASLLWNGLDVSMLDLDPELEGSAFALVQGPQVALIGSGPSGPGSDACADRLARRESLSGCLLMRRLLRVGPWREIFDDAIEQGLIAEVSDDIDAVLDRPRNRNPRVKTFHVSGASGTPDGVEIVNGGRVQVAAGDTVDLQWLPEPDDFDDYASTLDGIPVQVDEGLAGQWVTDRALEGFVPGALSSAEFDAGMQNLLLDCHACNVQIDIEGPPGIITVYFVVRDDMTAEGWGWVELDVQP